MAKTLLQFSWPIEFAKDSHHQCELVQPNGPHTWLLAQHWARVNMTEMTGAANAWIFTLHKMDPIIVCRPTVPRKHIEGHEPRPALRGQNNQWSLEESLRHVYSQKSNNPKLFFAINGARHQTWCNITSEGGRGSYLLLIRKKWQMQPSISML